jgi:hypothetical protein
MTNQPSINDWAEYLIWAEKNLKDLEDMLLHKQYDIDQIETKARAINLAITQTVNWARNAKQAKRP